MLFCAYLFSSLLRTCSGGYAQTWTLVDLTLANLEQFGTGILIKWALPKGGVHKLQIFSREKYIQIFQKSSA